MAKQLPDSALDRSNILNNYVALETLQHRIGIRGVVFEGELKYTSRQVADFYEVDRKTVNRYLTSHATELKDNGYEVYSGQRLQEFKEVWDIDVPDPFAPSLGIFNFRALINLGLLLVESERARLLRRTILDLVIDVVSAKAGGSTKYINQRDESYLLSLYLSENYRNEFKSALKECVDMGNKYAVYTSEIYKSIFKERAQDYRKILDLKKEENVRDTMYAEVLTTISMYETGLANEIRKKSTALKRKLTSSELEELFKEFENNPIWVPQIEMVRMKMASRDYAFRSATHTELAEYIAPVDPADFERFLGEKSAELAKRVEQYQDVFKRLKDK